MITSQGFGKICEFSDLTPQLQIKNDVDNQLIYLPGTNCPLKTHISLSAFTSYRVGGEVDYYVSPQNLGALQASIEYAKENDLAITILGAGSNLLVSDRGIRGLVIATRHLRYKHFEPATGQLTVSAGEAIPTLAWDAAALGWEGLEWAVGIPGTVGGAVVMNAGAHNSCIADMLVSAQVLTPEELGYTYRSSLLQGGKRIVTQATFQLQPGADPIQVIDRTKEHKKHRLSTQPYSYPSCGSVFRNPQPYTAGWLIEQTGLKGYQLGGAQVAQLHANFIVNRGGAKASDIFSLIRHIQNEVQEHWSIWLEPEVKMLGEFPVCY
jgi:UDP-N-acetylmuramate dehydrogenase